MKTKIKNQSGVALVTSIVIISIIGFLVQGIFLLARNRAESSVSYVNYIIAKNSAKEGLDCAKYQIVRQAYFETGQTGNCSGQTVNFISSNLDNYNFMIKIKSSEGESCSHIHIDNNLTEYNLRADGFSICDQNNEPVVNSPDFSSHSIYQTVVYDEALGLVDSYPTS